MLFSLCSLFYLLLVLQFGCAFKAAVYEHVQQGDPSKDSGATIIEKNIEKYKEAARNASIQGADIIVFPEIGILSFKNSVDYAEDIPDPGTVNPCLERASRSEHHWPILSNLSCLARSNGIYLVANYIDRKPCVPSVRRNCTGGEYLYYNTDVAFDRNGTLVSRYHKNHLYGERPLVQPDPPEFAIFETDFGARVGIFICFDILFKEASELVTRFNVDVAVMSTMWFDELPQWYSAAIQESWAIRHNVTLLASGIQKPSTGTLGSGVYKGAQGPLIYTYSPDWKDKLLIADVDGPVPQNARYKDDLVAANDRVLTTPRNMDYAAMKLDPTLGTEKEVCQGIYCCSVQYAAPSMNDSFFLLFLIGHLRTSVGVGLGIQVCMVARCESKEGRPCGWFPYTSSTTFTRLELKANFPVPDVFPVVASDQLALTSMRHWTYNISPRNEAELKIDVTNPPPEPLLYAVLTARIYQNDIFPPTSDTFTEP